MTFSFKDLLLLFFPLLVCVVALVFLFILKRIVFYKLTQWAKKTTVRWDDILIDSLRVPLNFLIIVLAFGISQFFVVIPPHFDPVILTSGKLLVTFSVLLFLDRFLVGLLREYAAKNQAIEASQKIIITVIHLTSALFALLLGFSLLGISITPFLASLGIGSMAVALGLQDTLANAFAGMHINIDRPVKRGDFIALDDGREGLVETIGWRSTRLKLSSNNIVIIPNSKLASSVITNYEMPEPKAIVKVECGVDYGSDLEKVERVVLEEATRLQKEHPQADPTFNPIFRFKAFLDSSIQFYVTIQVKRYVEHMGVRSELIKRLHKRFQKEGIVIPFPIRTVHLQQEKNS